MVQGKITDADIMSIQMCVTPFRLISDSPPTSPIFMPDALSAATVPLHSAWDKQQICCLARPVQHSNCV